MELQQQPSVIPLYIACLLKKPQTVNKDNFQKLSQLSLTMKDVKINHKKLIDFKKFFDITTNNKALPISFLHLLVFRPHLKFMLTKQLPFPVLGLVHMYNDIISHHDVYIDDVVNIDISITEINQTKKGTEITLHSKIFKEKRLVWESFSGYLHPNKQVANQKKRPKKPRINMTYAHTQFWKIPTHLGRQYAVLSGDANPIHLTAFLAKLFGFKQAIAHGMCMAFKCCAELESLQHFSRPAKRLKIQFNKPVYLPSDVEFKYSQDEQDCHFCIITPNAKKPLLTGTLWQSTF
mgnify:CR=1 FL=1